MNIEDIKKSIRAHTVVGSEFVAVKIDDLRQLVELAEQASPKGDTDASVGKLEEIKSILAGKQTAGEKLRDIQEIVCGRSPAPLEDIPSPPPVKIKTSLVNPERVAYKAYDIVYKGMAESLNKHIEGRHVISLNGDYIKEQLKDMIESELMEIPSCNRDIRNEVLSEAQEYFKKGIEENPMKFEDVDSSNRYIQKVIIDGLEWLKSQPKAGNTPNVKKLEENEHTDEPMLKNVENFNLVPLDEKKIEEIMAKVDEYRVVNSEVGRDANVYKDKDGLLKQIADRDRVLEDIRQLLQGIGTPPKVDIKKLADELEKEIRPLVHPTAMSEDETLVRDMIYERLRKSLGGIGTPTVDVEKLVKTISHLVPTHYNFYSPAQFEKKVKSILINALYKGNIRVK